MGNWFCTFSVMIISTHLWPVKGSEHWSSILCLPPLAVCSIVTMTLLPLDTRSMAPPIPFTILPWNMMNNELHLYSTREILQQLNLYSKRKILQQLNLYSTREILQPYVMFKQMIIRIFKFRTSRY